MSWVGASILFGTLGAIVWGTLRLLAAVDRIEGKGVSCQVLERESDDGA